MISRNEEIEKLESVSNVRNLICRAESNYKVFFSSTKCHNTQWQCSLTLTYPRFKCGGVNIFFQLLPSKDCYFDCEPSTFVRSQKGVPKLDVYI